MRINSRDGFTMVEIVIVLCIFSILLAVTLPSLQKKITEYRFEGAARQLVADIKYLQQKALAESSGDYNIKFYNNYYQLNKSTKTIKKVQLPANTKLEYFTSNGGSYDIMGISARGTATPGTITLYQSELKKNLYIKIAVTTGRVRLSSTYDSDL
ncbi:type II secretion system protein [Desulforamulus putei]|uniref:pilus assembly FimT family protein n=1 Tax=Desulforamulus putei TaxID=74701 RepID=UPI002FDDDBCA